MVDDLKQTNGLPRLNPFAFPSDTDFRFFLLIVSVLAAGLFIYNSLYYSVPSNSSNFIQTLRRCTQESEAAFPGTDLNARIARNNFFEQCRKQQEQIQALWIIGGVLILLFVGSLIYLTFPWRKVKKEKLVPFTELDSPEAVSLLKDLCREAGLSRQPDFVWNPLNLTSSGSAFGILGRYKIALGGGLVTKFFTDRPAFRAVVLHELGHISNGDINKTYFAVAIWQSFLLVGVLPLALSQLGSNNELDFIFALTWRTFALAGLVYLTRNAVLRAREVYADLRATLWEGTTSVIERVIGELISQKKNLFSAITDLHPVPAERRKVLENTDRLFRLGYWEAFGTGIIATISFPNVLSVLSLLLPVNVSANATLFATLIFGPLAVEVVGLQIWRASFAALMRGKTLRGVGRLGLCFGFGIVLGRLLAFDSAFVAIEEQTDFAIQIVNIGYGIIWSGILCASLFFLMRWIAMGAKGWLEIAIHELSPRPIYLAGLFIASIVLTVWLSTLFQSRDLGVDTLGNIFSIAPLASFELVIMQPLALLSLLCLWALPLSASFFHGRRSKLLDSSWAFTNASSSKFDLSGQPSYRLGFAMIVGLMAGVAFCALLLILRITLRVGLSDAVRSTDEYKIAFYYFANIVPAILIQMGASLFVAIAVKRLGGAHSLFTAFIAGCVMTAGIIGLNLAFGGTADFAFMTQVFYDVVNGGALFSLPMAFLFASLASWIQSLRSKSTPITNLEQKKTSGGQVLVREEQSEDKMKNAARLKLSPSPVSPPELMSGKTRVATQAKILPIFFLLAGAGTCLTFGIIVFAIILIMNNSQGIASTSTLSGTATREPILPTPTAIATDVPLLASPTAAPTIPRTANTPTPSAGTVQRRGGDNAEMVYIPAGNFKMGSDSSLDNVEPAHQVYLDAFWIDKYEVTNARYEKCVDAGKCRTPSDHSSPTRSSYYGDSRFGNYPVIFVSWHHANAYCQWAGKRLPTEAEWEKAARGIDERTYPWGNTFDKNKANTKEGAKGDTAQIGNYPGDSSPFGVMDMAGNVIEWVADWYEENYYSHSPSRNPKGPSDGSEKVVRGGGWPAPQLAIRTYFRFYFAPNVIADYIGFRCVQ